MGFVLVSWGVAWCSWPMDDICYYLVLLRVVMICGTLLAEIFRRTVV